VPDAEILLVEDDDLNQALVPAILARSDQPRLRDAHVTVAGTLAQARAVLAAGHIDLVLLDMHLPDGSGLPLAEELRDRPGRAVAVIALTGAPAEHGDDAFAAGCLAVLGKPYGLEELRTVVAAHLPSGQSAQSPAAVRQAPAVPAQAGPGDASAASAPPMAGHQAGPGDASWAGAQAPPMAARQAGPGDASWAGAEAPPMAARQAGPGDASWAGAQAPPMAARQAPPADAWEDQAATPVDFGMLFAAVPGAYLALDPSLKIVAVSDAYARATRTSPGDLLGRSVWEALPEDPESPSPAALPGLRACLDKVCQDRVPVTMEIQKCFLPPADVGRGTYEACYFRPVNLPVFGPGRSLRYIIHALEDVTSYQLELEQARQERQAARDAKTEYVSRVSHELRTPINTILGFGELLSLGDLTAEHREWASMMVKAARHLASFIDDIADISRAEMHRLSVSIEPVRAGSVISDALDLMRPLSASHGVHLDPPPPAAQHVFADPRRLRQVLLNLLSNAVKYNHPAGRVTVTVDPQQDGRLRICIRDTGRGIADYDIGQLFTPFQRLDAAQAGIEGAGLGLTLSRQLIEAMGGTIGATSAAGEGSVFWVELPVAEPAAAADALTGADPVVEARAYTAPKTILYVEDMLETLLLVEHILRQRPSTSLVPAMLGGAALDLAAEYRPHLILLDLHLPDIPGEALLRRLKADPATSATPVVVISGETSGERIDSLIALGAAAYLTKPISVRDFLHTVDTLLTAPRPAPAAADGDQARLAEIRSAEARRDGDQPRPELTRSAKAPPARLSGGRRFPWPGATRGVMAVSSRPPASAGRTGRPGRWPGG
jgi:signal transduction histidine kinase/CheY-like chemotaxis protein